MSESYVPFARRYRPTQFHGERGLIGQPHVARTLTNALRDGALANAYLMTGPRGTGKTTTARILAAALNCAQRLDTEDPCGTCDSCRRIIGGKESTDVIEIDAATNRGADDARQLRQQAMYAPSTERAWKVYIVDEAHMLTREAWNALLKILEEPPPRVLFVFCTTEPQKIQQAAPPILSRCQRLDMRRLTTDDLRKHLRYVADREHIAIEDDAINLLARRADGGMRDALSMLDQMRAFGAGQTVSAETVRSAFGIEPERTFLALIDIIATGQRKRIFQLVRHLDSQGTDFIRFLEDWQDTLVALAEVQAGGVAEGWSEAAQATFMVKAGRNGTPPVLPIEVVIDLIALCQHEALLIRQASRPSTPVLTLLQRSITRAAKAKAA